MQARLLSFVVWGLVTASAVFWASRFLARPVPVPTNAAIVGPAALPSVGLAPLFGAPAPEPPVVAAAPPAVVDSRFKLIGVAAGGAGRRGGLALIAVGDGPARAISVGGQVDGDLVVLAISHRQVDLGPAGGAATTSLTLPELAEAARGVPQRMAPSLPAGMIGIPPSEAARGVPQRMAPSLPAGMVGIPPAAGLGNPGPANMPADSLGVMGNPPGGPLRMIPPMPGRPLGATPSQLMAPQHPGQPAEAQPGALQR